MRSVASQVSTLILDLDGPLLDGSARHYACYITVMAELGQPPLPQARYWSLKRDGARLAEILALSGSAAHQAAFAARWLELIETPDLLRYDRVQPGVSAALAELRAAGLTLVVATLRREPTHLADQLARLGLRDLVDLVLAVPHPEGGAGKARRLRAALPQLEPSSCLWIGDSEVDVVGARALGCPIWLVSCGVRNADYLAALHPDALIRSLTDLQQGHDHGD